MELAVEIGPLAVLVRHFLRLLKPFDSHCRIIPAQSALRFGRVECAIQIKRLDASSTRYAPSRGVLR
jgi:hypothetical protein